MTEAEAFTLGVRYMTELIRSMMPVAGGKEWERLTSDWASIGPEAARCYINECRAKRGEKPLDLSPLRG